MSDIPPGYFDYQSPTLKNILQEFAGHSWEILLVAGLIVALISGSIAVFMIQRKRARRKRIKESRQTYNRILSHHELSPSEEELLTKLLHRIPDWETKGHTILKNKNVFDAAVRRLLQEEPVPGDEITRLRIKLGLKGEGSGRVIHSSASLEPGTHILLVLADKRAYARVSEIDADGLVVNLREERRQKESRPGFPSAKKGDTIEVYFKAPNGTFHFASRVLSTDGNSITIAHSEAIEQSQRRRYFRIRANIPAWIRRAGSSEELQQSRIVNLSGGGAKLINTGSRFAGGEELEIRFRTEGDDVFSLQAHVERLSSRGSYLHISFGPISEGMRDRIISYVLKKGG